MKGKAAPHRLRRASSGGTDGISSCWEREREFKKERGRHFEFLYSEIVTLQLLRSNSELHSDSLGLPGQAAPVFPAQDSLQLTVMQVSFACTDHGLKAPRTSEPNKQNTSSPNTASAARARFRTVALIARSLGSFTHRHHISLKESTGKLTGMKYRYGKLPATTEN